MAQPTNQRVADLKRQLLDALTDAVMDTLQESCHIYLQDQARGLLWEQIHDALRGHIQI